jgi:hypothetical protein
MNEKTQFNVLYVALGLIFGAALGLLFGPLLFDDTSVGITVGTGLGLLIGAVLALLQPKDSTESK